MAPKRRPPGEEPAPPGDKLPPAPASRPLPPPTPTSPIRRSRLWRVLLAARCMLLMPPAPPRRRKLALGDMPGDSGEAEGAAGPGLATVADAEAARAFMTVPVTLAPPGEEAPPLLCPPRPAAALRSTSSSLTRVSVDPPTLSQGKAARPSPLFAGF